MLFKRSYFGFGSSPNNPFTGMQGKIKKTLELSYNILYALKFTYLKKKKIMFQTPPLCKATLLWLSGDPQSVVMSTAYSTTSETET